MRVHKALFHMFQFGYSEEYCSTFHTPDIICHSKDIMHKRFNNKNKKLLVVVSEPNLFANICFMIKPKFTILRWPDCHIWVLHIAIVGYFFSPSLPNMEGLILKPSQFFFYQKSFIFCVLENRF